MSTLLPAVADRSGGASSAPAASSSSTKKVVPYLRGIFAGLPWTARRVRNLNLRAHCRMVGCARTSRHSLPGKAARLMFARLCEVVECRSRILTDLHPNEMQAVPALFRMAAYHDRIIRAPEEWQPDATAPPREQWASLVSHLFEKWPVPRAFASAWFTVGPVRHLERDWFCSLAAGGSLRRLPGMRPLTASAAREVPSAPADLSAREAFRWAQFKVMKCPDALAAAAMRSCMANDFANDGIWLPLLEKFIATPGIDAGEFGLVADGFRYLIYESSPQRARELLRQPLPDLVRHWRKRWGQLFKHALPPGLAATEADVRSASLRARVAKTLLVTWQPTPYVFPYYSPAGFRCRENQHWTIGELCTQRLLLEEGAQMRHCVILYDRSCRKGRCAIFRMRLRTAGAAATEFDKSTSWTIRVNIRARLIVEIKGYRNRLPAFTELSVIWAWARHSRLRFARRLR